MIKEDYVSFEVAKLLKDNGFDGECRMIYREHDMQKIYHTPNPNDLLYFTINREKLEKHSKKNHCEYCLCPTIQMARKWLREKHRIDIVVNPYQEEKPTQYLGLCIKNEIYYDPCEYFEKYEDAAVSAIRYALKNLI